MWSSSRKKYTQSHTQTVIIIIIGHYRSGRGENCNFTERVSCDVFKNDSNSRILAVDAFFMKNSVNHDQVACNFHWH